jgi:hypothetical protein
MREFSTGDASGVSWSVPLSNRFVKQGGWIALIGRFGAGDAVPWYAIVTIATESEPRWVSAGCFNEWATTFRLRDSIKKGQWQYGVMAVRTCTCTYVRQAHGELMIQA